LFANDQILRLGTQNGALPEKPRLPLIEVG